jgi:DNA-directed RNA polymerase subunit alpha
MQKIPLPKKIEFIKGNEPHQGLIVIEPCFPGYGITLGNSLRRVLLSSLPGAAVVGVKIKGVDHEFSAIPHLKEDILEFMLKIKQIRLKIHADETVKLELSVHGKKEITAGDIKKNSSVEIANPELVLGNITDMAGSIEMEIYVEKGMGYEMIENREKREKEIGLIEIDSIFSPVIKAGIKVDNVRVGKLTNYDKLILDIKTDGTITPEAAFNESVKILIEQYKSLVIGKLDVEEETANTEEEAVIETKKENEEEIETADGDTKKKRGRPKKIA